MPAVPDLKKGQPQLVRYSLPGCSECAGLDPLFAELEKEWSGRVTYRREDASTKEAVAEMRRFGVKLGEGVALLGQDGYPKFVRSGHEIGRDELDAELRAGLAQKPGEPEGYGK